MRPYNMNPRRGEQHPNALLTEKEVRAIRKKWRTGKYMQIQLCEEYGVARGVMSRLVNNLSWQHVK